MKKLWKKPLIEVLDISMTMNGPGDALPDCFDVGENNGNMTGNQDPATSNASCKELGS